MRLMRRWHRATAAVTHADRTRFPLLRHAQPSQRARGRAVAGLPLAAALADPAVQLVAVEVVVAAVDEAGGDTAVQLEDHRAQALSQTSRIEHRGNGPDGPDRSGRDRPDNVDLVRYLVVEDAAAPRGIELLGPAWAVQ